jgi:hypothetical protein
MLSLISSTKSTTKIKSTINSDVSRHYCERCKYIFIESEEFVKNQNHYINYRRNSPLDNRYAEIGADLGLHYNSTYE